MSLPPLDKYLQAFLETLLMAGASSLIAIVAGLGLAIVREIAQKHQASVEIHDHPTAHSSLPGMRVRVVFPLYAESPEPVDS